MAETVTIARPYAEAAFRIAREKNALNEWSQMLGLLTTIVQDPRIAQRIGDPNVGSAQLEALILGVCGERLDGAGRNFVQVLIDNGRLALMPEIQVIFEALKREQEGVLEAEIFSAFPIDDTQIGALVGKLEAKYRRTVRAQVSVDPQLIGGVKIIVGDKVLDATVRGRLDAMATALTR
jgi:F-type H+-transporting ATPase subunit delta